jgi:putative transposase
MARLARVVAVDVPHHVTQRANARQFILNSGPERMVYMDLLRQAVQLHPLCLLGYCLMSNHVHLVVIPHNADALAVAFKEAHCKEYISRLIAECRVPSDSSFVSRNA